MKIWHFLLAAGILAISGCAAVAERDAFVTPDFASVPHGRVAVAPVFFADEPLDWYYGERIAQQLRRETVRRLESKGYEATLLGDTLVRHVPTGTELPALAPPVPSAADALLVIRMDHYLDAGLYNDGGFPNSTFFELHATAALLDSSRKVLWQDSGVGAGSRNSRGFAPLEEFIVPEDLARSLFASLPPAR